MSNFYSRYLTPLGLAPSPNPFCLLHLSSPKRLLHCLNCNSLPRPFDVDTILKTWWLVKIPLKSADRANFRKKEYQNKILQAEGNFYQIAEIPPKCSNMAKSFTHGLKSFGVCLATWDRYLRPHIVYFTPYAHRIHKSKNVFSTKIGGMVSENTALQ